MFARRRDELRDGGFGTGLRLHVPAATVAGILIGELFEEGEEISWREGVGYEGYSVKRFAMVESSGRETNCVAFNQKHGGAERSIRGPGSMAISATRVAARSKTTAWQISSLPSIGDKLLIDRNRYRGRLCMGVIAACVSAAIATGTRPAAAAEISCDRLDLRLDIQVTEEPECWRSYGGDGTLDRNSDARADIGRPHHRRRKQLALRRARSIARRWRTLSSLLDDVVADMGYGTTSGLYGTPTDAEFRM
jgi:hypothetical protein